MFLDRTDRVLSAVLRRIADQGDMPIRISWHTMRVIRRALGVEHWDDMDDFRDVDAVALELLLILARQARAAATNSQRSTER